MDWILEQWPTIVALLGLAGSLLRSHQLRRILNAVIAGVEAYSNDVDSGAVKEAIKEESVEAGVASGLAKIVDKETK